MYETNTAMTLENTAVQSEAVKAKTTKTTKAKTAKAAKSPVKKSTKPVEKAQKNCVGFKGSICEPNPGYCETIIANATKTAGGVMYASVPIGLIDLDTSYQRELGPHVYEIAMNWDEMRAGALCVNYRDGRFYAWDGQNRYAAAVLNGAIPRLYCMISVGWTREQEALAFAKQNERKRRLNSTDRIRAEIIGGDPIAMSVKKVCDEFGVTCVPHGGRRVGALWAADRAKRIVASYGEDMLRDIFTAIQNLEWNGEQGGYSTVVLHSLRNVLLMSKDREATLDTMRRRTQCHELRKFMLSAKSRFPSVTNSTDAMTKLWECLL